MSTQPDNILLSFLNVDELSTDGGRSNDTHYYYREGQVYIDGQENIPEFKRLNLSNDQLSKTTMVVIPGGAGTYNTIDGFNINYSAGDMILVVHNYTGNTDLYDTSKFSSDSWWYDTNWHKMYRVYLRVGYTETESRSGETLYNWRVKEVRKVYRTHDEDDKSGVYTFTNIPPEDIGITASVRVDKYSTGNVWETVKLNLYYNDSLLGSETLDTTVTPLPTTMNLLIDRAKEDVNINDELKMSVEVENAPSTHNDSLFITEYTMSISSDTSVDAPETILGFSNNLGLSRDFDCQPTLNNTMVARQSEFIQDVDYSISSEGSGSVTPQNLSQILSNQATKATVPDSNYTQYSSIIPKYYGSKTNRTGINLSSSVASNSNLVDNSTENDLNLSPFYFTTDNLGSFPNVESKNTYLGYFEKVIDPYPVLNGKTAYYVKYLVDKNTDVQDPSLSVQGLNNLKNTFKTNDVNSLPTSVKASVQNIDEARELKDLETLSTVYKTGVYPSPILYSQTSSTDYSTEIVLSGSSGDYLVNFDLNSEDYRNLAFISTDTFNEEGVSTPSNPILALGKGSIFAPDNTETIGTPNENIYQDDGVIRVEQEVTDDYVLTVNYNFFTTHIPPQFKHGAYNGNQYSNTSLETNFGQFLFQATKDQQGSTSTKSIKEVNVQLVAWSSPTLQPLGINEGNSQVVNLTTNKVYNETNQSTNIDPLVERFTDGRFQINFNSEQIYNALNEGSNSWPLYLRTRNVNTAWNNRSTQTGAVPEEYLDLLSYEKGNYLEWKISMKIDIQDAVNLRDLSAGWPAQYNDFPYEVKVKRTGNINSVNSGQGDLFFRLANTSGGITYHKRSFNPPSITNSNKNNIRFDLRGNNTPTSDQLGKAFAPFWKHLPGSNDRSKIYLTSNLLNNNYNKNYYQVGLDYTPGSNTNFPFSIEPPFVNIPTPVDQWKLEIGDEIRFENLESKTYIITNIYSQLINDTNGEFERIVLQLDRAITQGIVLDFFLIRRFKPSNNFVILNQQKPYGVPPSASSAPGILQTQFQSEELETNPDKVITNLIERDLI